ncbi:hypothetical protein GC170_14575 [bacterium]|nr:hypothetical protein [bacterium]
MKTSKFCAGATIDARMVESIHHASEIATTGTPAAFMGHRSGGVWTENDTWASFAFVVAVFALALVMDRVEGRK